MQENFTILCLPLHVLNILKANILNINIKLQVWYKLYRESAMRCHNRGKGEPGKDAI